MYLGFTQSHVTLNRARREEEQKQHLCHFSTFDTSEAPQHLFSSVSDFSRVNREACWKWMKQLRGCLSSAPLHLSVHWPYFHWKFSAFPWTWRRTRRWSHASLWSHNPTLGTEVHTGTPLFTAFSLFSLFGHTHNISLLIYLSNNQ